MIRLLDDLSLLNRLTFEETYTACLFMADGEMLLSRPELMNIWVELDERGRAISAVRVDSEEVTILCGSEPPGLEMFLFISKFSESGVKRIICGEAAFPVLKKLFPVKFEQLCSMRCSKAIEIDMESFDIKENIGLDNVFELIKEGVNPQKELWMLKMLRGTSSGQITVLSIENCGRAVATASIRGRIDGFGAIASVFTSPEFRGRGYASVLTAACSKILSGERREALLLPAGEEAKRLYEHLGFVPDGKHYYILHLDEKEK